MTRPSEGHKSPPGEPLLVVGVGASAGGLEAVQAFLRPAGPDCGLAFVVLFHQGPAARGLLPEVLGKATSLPVVEAADGMPVEPGRVYAAPAQSVVTLEGGALRVAAADRPEDRRAPIDRFLHSLARERGEAAVAVILSGSGSDGALGLKAVGEAGGLTMAQGPATAKHDSMPQSALATGAVDRVLAPDELGEELVAYARHRRDAAAGEEGLREQIADALPAVCELLLQHTGHNFKHYKTSTLVRRTLRRLQVLRLGSAREYLERLRADRAELEGLFRDLLIGVTAFFRDPEAFEALAREVLPKLFEGRAADGPVRVWVPGCATGEEAYTLAMLLREQMDRLESPPDVQVFATDIDEQALATARLGSYPLGIADEVPPARLARFFVKRGQQYQVARELRELVLFSVHNLINDPPFSRLDLISCRNLLIYLGSHLQKKLIPLFHYALKPGGYLFLGPSESLTAHRELFRPIDARHRLSQRLPTAVRPPGLLAGRDGPPTAVRPPNVPNPQENDTYLLMQRIVLDEFAPKTVVVNAEGQVVCASGNLEKYLTVSAGAFRNNLLRLAREGLRVGLRSALAEAARVQRKVTQEGLSVRTDAGAQRVMVAIQPMPQMGEESGLYLVVFQDVGLPLARDERPPAPASEAAAALIDQLERELTSTRDDLERAVQELEAANEELKSGNEELLSMNEELQSANEELETSKEEVQDALDALARANADLENLLASTQIATLFLDEGGLLRRVTPAAAAVYNVTPADAGRPLSHFTHLLKQPPPMPTAEQVRRAERPFEDEVEALDGHWYLRRVLPYRNQEGRAEGTVITFTDVTSRRRAEEALRDSEQRHRALFDQATAGIVQYDLQGRIVLVNRRYCELMGRPAEELYKLRLHDVTHADDLPRNLELFERAAREGAPYEIEKRYVRPDGVAVWVSKSVSAIRGGDGRPTHVMAVVVDVTDRKRAEADLADAHRRLEESFALLDALTANAPVGMAFVDRDFRFVRVNEAMAETNGRAARDHVGRTVAEVVPQLWPALAPLARQALAGTPVLNVEVSGEVASTPGRRRHWLVNYYPIRAAADGVLGVGMVVAEITIQKHAADMLRESDRRKDEFLATLGHELRNPLAPIRNAVQVLRMIGPADGAVREARDMIDRQVHQMARLVDDLLDVSRISENKLALHRERVELASVVGQAVETVRPLADASAHQLEVALPEEPVWLDADPARLAQVFWNLLHNACKYTDKGGRITLTARRDGPDVVVRVKDNGIGLRPEHLPRLFEKFSQVAAALERSQGGLGLGLSLVRGLVEMHGGRVAAHSEGPGKGTEFVVRLPVSGERAAVARPRVSEGGATRLAESRRILVVDDNVDAALSLAMLLQLSGNEVETAHDGGHAVELAERFRPGVVLMDLGMPGLNGYDACRRIRALPWGAGVVLVALTGWGQDEDRRRAADAGFDHHLVKPVDPAALVRLLAEGARRAR